MSTVSSLAAPLRAVDRWWYAAMPAERIATLRILVGGFALAYLLIRAPALISPAEFAPSAFAPVGPVSWLRAPLPPWAVYATYGAAVVTAVPFVAGARHFLFGPLFALLLLWVTSYRSSWGMIFHTENLLALHALLLAAAPAADARSVDARGRVPASPHGRYGWAVRAMCLVTVLTYVLAGVAKLRNSGVAWTSGDVLRVHIAYDNLRKIELGSIHSPLGAAMVSWGWLFPPLAWLTLVFEIGAPAALLGRRVAAIWAIGAWFFHFGVLLVMAIAFPYPLSGVAFASFFRAEKLRLPRRKRPCWSLGSGR